MDLISVSRAVTQKDIDAWGAHPPPVVLETLSGAPIAVRDIAVDDRLVWIAGEQGPTPRRIVVPRAEASKVSVWPTSAAMYAEGSAALRNYSVLTKDLRVLAGQLLVAYSVGVGLIVTHVGTREIAAQAAFAASAVILLFAASLWLVNLHYGTAFLGIRDSLARLEGHREGPWRAHKRVRQANRRDDFAYAAPFLALALAGVVGGSISVGEWTADGRFGWSAFALGLVLLRYCLRMHFRFMARVEAQCSQPLPDCD